MMTMAEESWIRRELLTPRRAIFNALFYGSQLFFFALGWYLQETNDRLYILNLLKYSVWVSRGAGLVLAYHGGLILLPMLRNVLRLLRPKLVALFPADENIWFHRQVAYTMAFWAAVHTTGHYINFINVERLQARIEDAQMIHYTQAGGITGHFLLFIMLLMYTTAHHKIRHQSFEAFWYTHHLAFFFFVGLYSHATGCFVRDTVEPAYTHSFPFYDPKHCLGYNGWRYIIWPGVIYIFERIWREYRARQPTRLSKVLVHPSGAMEIRIVKPNFKYLAGQWAFLQVPSISKFQWHPFTITSAPEDPYISMHIRQSGDWTMELGRLVGAGPEVVAQLTRDAMRGGEKEEKNERGDDELTVPTRGDFVEIDLSHSQRTMPMVYLDGPYGAPSEDVFNNEVAVLVGAGIGVTPFSGILKHIWYRQREGKLGALRRVEFFWVCRDAPAFGWFQSLLQEVEAAQIDPNFLRINIYLTQKVDEDMMWNLAVNNAGASYDPLTLLRTRTMFGRPDWQNIFSRLHMAIEEGHYLPGAGTGAMKMTVGTFFCGPTELGRVVKKACRTNSSGNVSFKFAKEHF